MHSCTCTQQQHHVISQYSVLSASYSIVTSVSNKFLQHKVQMKILSFFFYFLLQGVLLIPATGILYYVKPSPATTKCPGEPCDTLQHYFENVHTAINQQKNVTMIFMDGTHAVHFTVSIVITVPVVNMTGVSHNTILNGSSSMSGATWLNFNSFTEVYLSDLVMARWAMTVLNTNTSRFMMLSIILYQSQLTISTTNTSFRFDSCEFYDEELSIDVDRASVTMENCKLTRNSLSVQHSTVVLSGISQLTDTNQSSAISSYFSNITLSGVVTFANNRGIRGGAMALYLSTLYLAPGTNVLFINNSAMETGGAIYVDPSLTPHQLLLIMEQVSFPETATEDIRPRCFYQLLNCSVDANYTFSFANNSAVNGGDDIYGASLQFHQGSGKCNLNVSINNSGISSVSSDPTRVCLCDSEGTPQCKNNSYIFRNYAVHPGEMFAISAVVVGGDFGAARGPIYADFLPSNHPSLPSLTSISQYTQVIGNITHCSNLNYSIHDYDHENIVMYLTTVYIGTLKGHSECGDESCFHTTPVYLNITLLPCLPGFTLLGEPPVCDCYPVLTDNNVECDIIHGRGVFSWNGSQWVDIDGDSIVYSQYCPFNYCDINSEQVDLIDDPDSQCAFNRAGRLCGGCKENYSLAIGSSHCIHCPNNNNLALLIFFAAAGFLLVLVISAFNLTVTQGMINGLIFYANIVWTYQCIFFPEEQKLNTLLVFLKTFIAWVNLDFGIETCFVDGLTAFWKTWLQFVFPFYIMAIAGLIIVAAKYSTRLTNLLANKAVPVLNTLFLLSYMKLLRIVAAALEFSTITEYPEGSTSVVWSKDGNLSYFGFPHILLFLAGLATLLFLWLPYTLLLFSIQWLRRLPFFMLTKWIMRFHPVYDAYFAPLKHKHQYWFGVLLLARGILLVIFASTFTVPQSINLLLLLIFGIILLFYMALTQPYKNKAVLLLQSSFLMNLTLLSGFAIFARTHPNGPSLHVQAIAVGLSTGVAFLQFCGIILHAVIAPRCSCKRRSPERTEFDVNIVEPVANITDSTGYRDSILDDDDEEDNDDETQPLITNDSDAKYKQLE